MRRNKQLSSSYVASTLLPDERSPDCSTALGSKTGKGNSWTERRLCTFRSDRGIAAYR